MRAFVVVKADPFKPANSIATTYHGDAQGTTIAGTRLSTWGELTGTEGEPDANLTYLRARVYDAKAGLFVSRDPHPGVTRTPATLHDYAFANGNPVSNLDPSGLNSIGEQGQVTEIQGNNAAQATPAHGIQVNYQSGKALEKNVGKLLVDQFGKDNVFKQVLVEGPGGKRFIDFFVRVGDR